VALAFRTWMNILAGSTGLEDEVEEAQFRFKRSFELKVHKYQSDWRLQLLLAWQSS